MEYSVIIHYYNQQDYPIIQEYLYNPLNQVLENCFCENPDKISVASTHLYYIV